MAEGGAVNNNPGSYCCVCRGWPDSMQRMRSLRCGHAVCRNCSAASVHPRCTQCFDSTMGASFAESRPESFAEVNLEMSLPPQHRECEEKAEACEYRGYQALQRCLHCNLYLCQEHQRKHGQIILENAASDVRKLQQFKRQVEQQIGSNGAMGGDEECRHFSERVLPVLETIAQATKAIDALLRRPIATFEAHTRRHFAQRDKAVGEIDKMLDQLQRALRDRNYEEVLNAQRTFQYMQSAGAYLAVQQDCVPKFGYAQLDAAALEGQINALITATQGLREIQQLTAPAAASNEPAAAAAPSADEGLSNRMSCLYMTLGASTHFDGSKIETLEKPLDIDCFNEPGEPLVLFVAEASEDNSQVTLRSYTEPDMHCTVIPVAFRRRQQIIADFQPRRLAVLSRRRLIAMTDVCSNQYSKHIFVCDFTGLGQQKMFRIDRAKRLNGIHATNNHIYACDTADQSVFIVDYNSRTGNHKRIACNESIPCSVSTWNHWMLVVGGYSVSIFSLDSLQPVTGIQAERLREEQQLMDQTIGNSTFYVDSAGASSQVQPYRDIVHLSNGNFAVNRETSVIFHQADMTPKRSISDAEQSIPGLRLQDLMGMCAAEVDGKARIFLCDRMLRQISIIGFDV